MFLTVVQPSSPFTDDLIRGQFRKQIREVFRGVSWRGWSSFTELLGGLEHLGVSEHGIKMDTSTPKIGNVKMGEKCPMFSHPCCF